MIGVGILTKDNKRGWYTVFLSALLGCGLAATFPQFSMTIGPLAEQMNTTEQILLISDTVKSVGIVISMLISGIVYNKLGAKKTFGLGLTAMLVPQFCIPFLESVEVLMVLKFIQGMSTIMFPMFLTIIMEWIEESQIGISTAVFNGIFYGGGGIGAALAGALITAYDWKVSYIGIGIICLIVGIIWLLTIKENHNKGQWESNEKNELTIKDIITNPTVWLLVIAFFSTTFVLQAITVDMPIFSKYLGFTESETGKALIAGTIGIFSASMISGKISDLLAAKSVSRAKARIKVLLFGPMLIVLSVLALFVLDVTTLGVFFVWVLLVSFGAAWGLGTFYSILPEIFDAKTLPVVTGFAGGVGDMGMPLAPLVVGVWFGFKGLWNIGWMSCSVIAILSVLACIALLRKDV